MLSKLLLKNFQCHRRLLIDLDPHVTVIVGRAGPTIEIIDSSCYNNRRRILCGKYGQMCLSLKDFTRYPI